MRNKEVDLKVILMSQNARRGHNMNIRITNSSFENVAELKYFGATLTLKLHWSHLPYPSPTWYSSVENILVSCPPKRRD
jgi:hypothetical protein